jgi:GcrA cell cycle regulator
MSWDAKDVALLKKLWVVGQSAAQIARRLGCSRNAVCAKLTRLGLKRGHKPPTAKPKIRPVPKRKPALLAACARPVAKKVSRKTVGSQPKEFSKRQLYAMLAEAVRNTANGLAATSLGRCLRTSFSLNGFLIAGNPRCT